MKKFDPETMPENTSPTVRALRTFVERSIENEVDVITSLYGDSAAEIVEKSLRAVTFKIFHKNPKVHTEAIEDPCAFDEAIQKLFNITSDELLVNLDVKE